MILKDHTSITGLLFRHRRDWLDKIKMIYMVILLLSLKYLRSKQQLMWINIECLHLINSFKRCKKFKNKFFHYKNILKYLIKKRVKNYKIQYKGNKSKRFHNQQKDWIDILDRMTKFWYKVNRNNLKFRIKRFAIHTIMIIIKLSLLKSKEWPDQIHKKLWKEKIVVMCKIE